MADGAVDDKGAAAAASGAAVADKGAAADAGKGAVADAGKGAAAATIVSSDGKGQDDGAEKKGYWPDDWLARVSKGDEKRAKDFGKFQSPEALAEAYVNLQRRFSSGELRTALPKDAKPEELAAWRKDNGIPEKPDAYDLKGVEIPKEDKAVIDGFLNAAHGANFTPEQAKVAVSSYYAIQNAQAEARATMDERQRSEALDALNQEWGSSFRRNVNMVEGLLSKFPESMRDALKSARMPDGTALFNNPDALRGFAALALEINPAGVIAPAGGGDPAKGAMGEYKELQTFMKEKRNDWNKDEGKQQRFRELAEYLRKEDMIDDNGNEVVQRKKAA